MLPAMTHPLVPRPRALVLVQARHLLLDPSRCPWCGAGLAGSWCSLCGLDLTGPAGAAVWEASRAAAAALERQGAVVDDVRRTAAARLAPQPPSHAPTQPTTHARTQPAAPTPVRPAPPAAAQVGAGLGDLVGPWSMPYRLPAGGSPVSSPVPPPPPTAGPAWPPGPAPRSPRGAWPVQTVLVTLGAALLALASLVFLVFTWELLTLAVRAGVVALGTAGVLTLAVVLRRRGLRASAEAVAALGSALLTLDVWALWATGLLGGAPGWLVGGLGLLACGAVLAAYGVRTGLRSATVAAALLVPAAPLPLAAASRTAAGVLGALLLAFVLTSARHLPTARARVAERRVLTCAAVALASLLAVVQLVAVRTGTHGGRTTGAVLVVALALACLAGLAAQAAATRGAEARAWAAGSGALAALTAAVAVPAVTGSAVAWSAPAAAAVGALAALGVAARAANGVSQAPRAGVAAGSADADATAGRDTPPTTVAAVAAAVTAGALAVPELGLLAVVALAAVLEPTRATDGVVVSAAVTMLTTVLLAAALGVRLSRALRHVAVALTCAAVLEGVALLADGVVSAVGGFVAVAVVALVVPLPRPWRGHTRALAGLAATAGLVAAAPGAVGDATSGQRAALLVALLAAAVVVTVSARWGGAAVRAAGSCVTALLATGAAATAWRLGGGDPGDAALVAATLLGGVVVALVLLRAVPRAHRTALLPTAAAVQGLTWLAALASWAEGGAHTAALVALATAAAAEALALAALGRGRVGALPRLVAATLVVPAAAAAVFSAHLAAGVPGRATTSLAVGVLACAAVLAARALDGGRSGFREAVEISGAVVAAAALLAAPSPGVVTLELTLLAVTAGAVALAPDRRPVRWWALGLAVLASWSGLAARDVGVPEAYAAPLGLVLVGVGARRLRRAGAGQPPGRPGDDTGSGAALLGAGALLVGLPPALVLDPVVVGTVHLDRAATLTAALVLVAGLAFRLARGGAGARAAARTLAACVALLVALGPVRRAATALVEGAPAEVWGLGAALALGLATLAAHRARAPRAVVLTGVWAALLVATGPVLVVAATALTDAVTPLALVRVVAVGVLGTAWALVGVRRAHAAATAQGLTLLGLATASAVAGAGSLPVDGVLATGGLLAACVGGTWLAHDDRARSWAALGGPSALVLAPTLIGLQIAPEPWRWGVVVVGGVAAVLLGATRRLQAPLVVGGVVLAVEVALQLVAAAASVVSHVGWWPLLFVGGVALTVVGVTYERRLRDAREATRYVARLR
ncbi:hypothetical protein Celgi_1838 [Cellulomonas gilvus ATCC 13127]|uniref:Uncharacterized protein n=2 Tax=Cellulomonas gilvus TaxID=11 RepID=F8A6Z1_CELGA|nr:hypothetical protein Celgi_1838 [Cellulomonas gilvus ATCC 13127]